MVGETLITPQFFLASPEALAQGFESDAFVREEGSPILTAVADSYAASGLARERLLLKLDGFRVASRQKDLDVARCLGSQIASAIRTRPKTFSRLLPRIHFQLFGDAQTVLCTNHRPDLAPEIEYPPRYSMIRLIEEGGCAKVYLAGYQAGKKVAIKVLQEGLTAKQFAREVRILKHLHHRHIIRLIDEGDNFAEVMGSAAMDPNPFFVMEFAGDEDLADRLFNEDRLAWKEVRVIGMQLAEALGAAHAQGIIHRDIKPENVVLRGRGEKIFVKLIDFGHALDLNDADQKREGRWARIGTHEYMSPEQIDYLTIDGRADIYALGVLLFEMLTGQPPFNGTVFELMGLHTGEPPPRPSLVYPDLQIPAGAEAILLKAMAKKREERFQTMAEMAEAIRACR